MKVYVASKFENKEAVRAMQERLRALGHEITYDWTTHNPVYLAGEELDKYMEQCAADDYMGVVECDALVLINHKNCAGAFTELGIALALGIPVILLDMEAHHNVFLHLASKITYADNVDDVPRLLEIHECLRFGLNARKERLARVNPCVAVAEEIADNRSSIPAWAVKEGLL